MLLRSDICGDELGEIYMITYHEFGLEEFDKIIGIEKLKAVHLNDSKNPCSAHKDRHELIGMGHIGNDAIIRIINHPELRDLPFILETPNNLDGYAKEIKFLRNNYND